VQVKEMSASMGNYNSVGGAIKTMFRDEGIKGFYKGLYPNLLKVMNNILHPSLTSLYYSVFVLC